jgi:hypothetical protein
MTFNGADLRTGTAVEDPAGSTIKAVAHYDNSPANRKNPDPNQEVLWGPQSSNEMFGPFLEIVRHRTSGTPPAPIATACDRPIRLAEGLRRRRADRRRRAAKQMTPEAARSEWLEVLQRHWRDPVRPMSKDYWSSLDILSADELRDIQSEKLRSAVGPTVHSVLSQEVRRVGLTPSDVRSPDDIGLIPVTTRPRWPGTPRRRPGTFTAIDDEELEGGMAAVCHIRHNCRPSVFRTRPIGTYGLDRRPPCEQWGHAGSRLGAHRPGYGPCGCGESTTAST